MRGAGPGRGTTQHTRVCVEPEAAARCVQPQDAYGLEKLASEELAMHYDKDFALECRIARFHNIYGPYGTWKGGREKAPAAFCRTARAWPFASALVCADTLASTRAAAEKEEEHGAARAGIVLCCGFEWRKVSVGAQVHLCLGCLGCVLTRAPATQVLTSTDNIEMWGDGKQTRSFTFIDDCVEGILRITKSDFKEPLNLGSSEMVRALRACPPPLTPTCRSFRRRASAVLAVELLTSVCARSTLYMFSCFLPTALYSRQVGRKSNPEHLCGVRLSAVARAVEMVEPPCATRTAPQPHRPGTHRPVQPARR